MGVISSIRESISGAYDQYKQRVAHDERKLLAAAKSFGSLFFARFVAHYPPEQNYISQNPGSQVQGTPLVNRTANVVPTDAKLSTPDVPSKTPENVEQMTEFFVNLLSRESSSPFRDLIKEEAKSAVWDSKLGLEAMKQVTKNVMAKLAEQDAGASELKELLHLGETVGQVRDGIQQHCEKLYRDAENNFANFSMIYLGAVSDQKLHAELLGEYDSELGRDQMALAFNEYVPSGEARAYLELQNQND